MGRTRQPKTDVAEAVVGRAVVTEGGARALAWPLLQAPPRTTWRATPAGLPAVGGVVGMGLVLAAGPVPGVARQIDQPLQRFATRKDADGRGPANVTLEGVAKLGVERIAIGVTPSVPSSRGGFPFRFARQTERLAGLRAQPGAVGPRFEPANSNDRLGGLLNASSFQKPVGFAGRGYQSSSKASNASSSMRAICSQSSACLDVIRPLPLPIADVVKLCLKRLAIFTPLLLGAFRRAFTALPGAGGVGVPPAFVLVTPSLDK